jgi:protein-tyrosine phosphatase
VTRAPDSEESSVDSGFSVCFVCTGNICRSPLADVVFSHMARETELGDGTALADHVRISSAGTGPWHAGEPMDPRAVAVLNEHGYKDHGHIARQFAVSWFDHEDLIVCLARRHQQTLRSLAAGRAMDDRLVLLRSYDRGSGGAVDVPDPYYGEALDFEECLTLIEAGCRGLVLDLVSRIEDPPN